MKVNVVVVNDCGHVMEDLLPYLRNSFGEIEFLQRSRRWLSKTVGILWKIAKSKGDLYHVSYALQDAWLVGKLKHLDVLHVHGTDVRSTIHSKKYSWIVKSNLQRASKVVYATPDLEAKVKTFREDAVYLPTPVKTNTFQMKTCYSNKPKALYFNLKYEEPPQALPQLIADNGIELTIQEKNVPYPMMPPVLSYFDIFIDRFTVPSLSKTCLEAMSCGLATIDYHHINNLSRRVKELSSIDVVKETGRKNRRFIEENHNVVKVAKQLNDIWRQLR